MYVHTVDFFNIRPGKLDYSKYSRQLLEGHGNSFCESDLPGASVYDSPITDSVNDKPSS